MQPESETASRVQDLHDSMTQESFGTFAEDWGLGAYLDPEPSPSRATNRTEASVSIMRRRPSPSAANQVERRRVYVWRECRAGFRWETC